MSELAGGKLRRDRWKSWWRAIESVGLAARAVHRISPATGTPGGSNVAPYEEVRAAIRRWRFSLLAVSAIA